jgi:hypothetical protein
MLLSRVTPRIRVHGKDVLEQLTGIPTTKKCPSVTERIHNSRH